MIDLRSDTVTRPTPAMRRAMAQAEVGDDVFGEDPTTRRLEETVAELLGKEAALFVPSGVMGNQLAIKVHTRPGDEVILEENYHIVHYESGAPGVLSGVQLRTVRGHRGILHADDVRAAVRPGFYWEPQTRMVSLENTINRTGGNIYPLEAIHEVAAVVREHHLAFHLDGARLWNASVATGISEADFARPFDTVSVCLSKGLGAPVGSVLAGTKTLIQQARRYRKMFGGGMRQTGILAAAGLYAIHHHRERLADDHEKARRLAAGLAEIPLFELNPAEVETNIVMFDVKQPHTAEEILQAFAGEGILMVPFGPRTIRATTHLDVSMNDIETTLYVAHQLFSQ